MLPVQMLPEANVVRKRGNIRMVICKKLLQLWLIDFVTSEVWFEIIMSSRWLCWRGFYSNWQYKGSPSLSIILSYCLFQKVWLEYQSIWQVYNWRTKYRRLWRLPCCISCKYLIFQQFFPSNQFLTSLPTGVNRFTLVPKAKGRSAFATT